MSKLKAHNEEVSKILVDAKLLPKDVLDRTIKDFPDEWLEDSLVMSQKISEGDLLKALAAKYKTRFLGVEKLKTAELPQSTLAAIPKKMAETLNVFPITFDSNTGQLGYLTADPSDKELAEQVRLASGLQDIRPFLARPSAIRAAIAKSYSGNLQAFASFDNFAQRQIQQIMKVYEERVDGGSVVPPMMTNGGGRDVFETAGDAFVEHRERGAKRSMVPVKVPSVAPPARLPEPNDPWIPTIELCNVLVSLLEQGRGELRGHSSFVARLMRRMTEKMKLDIDQTAACVLAAHLHDIGKMGSFHLTSFNSSEFSGHKLAAQKTLTTPSRLIEGVKVPKETAQIIQHMYERMDGKGFPDGLKGKDIPVGARALAVVDTYADFNQNPRNSHRKILTAAETLAQLSKHKDTIYDGYMVDLLATIVLGDDLKARILQTKTTILLVDNDAEETTVLELRLLEQGLDVQLARDAAQALKIISENDVDLVVSEVDLAKEGGDGLKLLADVRQLPKGKDITWVAYTRKSDSATIQKVFELSADYIPKPASIDVLSAKIKMLVEQRLSTKRNARGVSGSLSEMGLPDLIQIVFHGRKSGNLRITSAQGNGEIHIDTGNVVNAIWKDKKGEEAFYALLQVQNGEFELDPSYKASERLIKSSSEALLLEGMRRLDEGIR